MVITILRRIFGTRNQRVLKQLGKIVSQINALEPEIKKLSDQDLSNKTTELKKRYQDGETLEQLLPEAFAVVREASVRTLQMRHFDVQLIGGMVLHAGKIAEMRTGEGKTLAATLPCYLHALTGKAVHVVTVNEYLAQRDADWMGPIYRFLGLSVGVIYSNQPQEEKKQAYVCDVIYGTNNEFGFDYLRDNMAFAKEDKVQRELAFAIVDEVDSILIDEARTPLIISGPAEDSSDLYEKIDNIVPKLKLQKEKDGPGDYSVDEKTKQAFLTEAGHTHVEQLFVTEGVLKQGAGLYDPGNIRLMHFLNACLRAHALFHRDVDYIVRDNEVIIVDEHTGRTMEGRRWSDGLHQAVEAKERVTIQSENQTLASITFQNYFRLYATLSGMTGTADTEAYEFQRIYGLEVLVIPTNKPMIRIDNPDRIYLTAKEKFDIIIDEIKACRERNQPVLVGTVAIESSEFLSGLLKQAKIPHEVLNAKQHEREAKIIAQAGRPDAVTIATNMAGRGTDIILGGNLEAEIAEQGEIGEAKLAELKQNWQVRHDQVIAAGGLHILGTERHESRRIDNQLRGRAGRQGDPGSSRFYLSLEDNLMRIFASERLSNFMRKLGMGNHEAIEHPFVTKAIESAQRKVEGYNFDVRKQLLEFDDVANEQRKVIYEQRDEIMAAADIVEMLVGIREDVVATLVAQYIPPGSLDEQWDIPGLERQLQQDFDLQINVQEMLEQDHQAGAEAVVTRVIEASLTAYQDKMAKVPEESVRQFEKTIMLQVLDQHWKEHLAAMDALREGIHLRGYAQKDPKQEYKRESFNMFTAMLESLKHDVISILARVELQEPDEVQELEAKQRRKAQEKAVQYQHASQNSLKAEEQAGRQPGKQTYVRETPKLGRNDPCRCGSGKKYKQCCGRL